LKTEVIGTLSGICKLATDEVANGQSDKGMT